MNAVFSDTEEMSQALRHTAVSAMQISRGAFEAQLSTLALSDWTLHFIDFRRGATICAGDAPRDRHALVVPLSVSPNSRLLGEELTDESIGLYAPGSEHADVTYAGQEIAVLFPNAPELMTGLLDGAELPRRGSRLLKVAPGRLQCLKSTLARLAAASRSSGERPERQPHDSLSDCLSCTLSTTLTAGVGSAGKTNGRPRLPRQKIVRQVFEILQERSEDIVHAGALARDLGLSPASLQRVFLEWFGTSPARYLAMRRYYGARQKLMAGAGSVTDVATSLGFWDLSRFAKSYKMLFDESPSDTLRRSRASLSPGVARATAPISAAAVRGEPSG